MDLTKLSVSLLTILAASSAPLSVSASCTDDAEVVRQHFTSVHDSMSEADHLQAEEALGQAYSLCSMGQDVDAATKLGEANGILAGYPANQPATSNQGESS